MNSWKHPFLPSHFCVNTINSPFCLPKCHLKYYLYNSKHDRTAIYYYYKSPPRRSSFFISPAGSSTSPRKGNRTLVDNENKKRLGQSRMYTMKNKISFWSTPAYQRFISGFSYVSVFGLTFVINDEPFWINDYWFYISVDKRWKRDCFIVQCI